MTGKAVITASWDDVPHITDKQKKEMLAALPPHQRAARSKGIPDKGAGAIYPVDEDDIVYKPFELPHYWPRCYMLDVGWNRTAALWGAWDRESDIVYAYAEHYRGEAEPSVHAAAIKARGDWIPGGIDPAARGRSQRDGKRLIDDYVDLGLHLTPVDNAVEAGIFATWERLSTGRLKICITLENTLAEMRLYRRDHKGAVVKQNDHLMDDLRYLTMNFAEIAITRPTERTRKVGKNTYR